MDAEINRCLKQRKNCKGCRAYEPQDYNSCSIGFKCINGEPKEPCSKPTTYDKLIKAQQS